MGGGGKGQGPEVAGVVRGIGDRVGGGSRQQNFVLKSSKCGGSFLPSAPLFYCLLSSI